MPKRPPFLIRDPAVETVPCPWCDGYGIEIVSFQGHDVESNCSECYGTGEVIELTGEDLPEICPEEK
jgi:DnaJ-class molecular chaperone